MAVNTSTLRSLSIYFTSVNTIYFAVTGLQFHVGQNECSAVTELLLHVGQYELHYGYRETYRQCNITSNRHCCFGFVPPHNNLQARSCTNIISDGLLIWFDSASPKIDSITHR